MVIEVPSGKLIVASLASKAALKSALTSFLVIVILLDKIKGYRNTFKILTLFLLTM
jgi:hypothetical protein